MKRTPGEPELVGAYEAAQILGVRQTNLRVIRGLPEPYVKLRSGTLYRADEIKALAWERLSRKVAGLSPTSTSTPHTQDQAA
jgi:hypothetical protein